MLQRDARAVELDDVDADYRSQPLIPCAAPVDAPDKFLNLDPLGARYVPESVPHNRI